MSWTLTAADLPDLARGATLLGTGGGGDPYIGQMLVEQVLGDGGITILDPEELADDLFVIPTAQMGAPTVMIEKIPAGTEPTLALRTLEAHLGRTESLRDVIARVGACWRELIQPRLERGLTVAVVAHGNSLRALCAVLDRLSDGEIRDLNLPTGHQLIYRLDAAGRPAPRGGSYLDPTGAAAAATLIAHQGGT